MRRCRVRINSAKKYRMLIRRAIRRAVKNEKLPYPCIVDAFLISNDTLREINLERRGIDKVTDVLSFPAWNTGETPVPEPDSGLVFLGDILIAAGQAAKQAEEYGHSFEREVSYLAAHGALHLMGYDHQTKKDKTLMRKKEEAVMEMLPYEKF